MWRTMITLLLTLAGGYLLLVVAVYFYQPHLLFLADLPSRQIAHTPVEIDLPYEDVHLQTRDGVRLHGWWVEHPQPRGTILFFHGNAGNISHRLQTLRLFHELGYRSLIIDYRGYGQSGGKPSETGLYADAEAAWRYLRETRQLAPGQIILSGRSLGAAVTFVGDVEAAHGVPTLATGAPCASFESPYLNACDYDAAGAMLATLEGSLAPRGSAAGDFVEVPVAGAADAGLLPEAWLYVPPDCAAGETCGLHVFFHGCSQSSELVGDAVVRGAGFNEWADSNRLLVLYPQVQASKLAPMNPLGCFDWWGYTGDRYATRDGLQLRAVKTLMETLAGKPL